ncbi:hypothetical protein KI387_032696, partial [Taxus chinensis]
MRLSCNGCRVLRKGCSDSCTLRPCLEWLKSAEAQANATVFLAKFYGRSGLMKLLNSGPNHLRSVVFRSLLYEACGRMVNPIHGSLGLQLSGNWHVCQAAVESVLEGQVLQMHEEPVDSINAPLISESTDIKPSISQLIDLTFTEKPLKPKNKGRFKRPVHRKSMSTHVTTDSQGCNLEWHASYLKEFESMFQIVQEEVEPPEIRGEEPVEEIFHKSISDMETTSDDSCKNSEEIDENSLQLELQLGSPVSHETVQQPHHFILCNSHWSTVTSCKDPSLNMASLNLVLSHPA